MQLPPIISAIKHSVLIGKRSVARLLSADNSGARVLLENMFSVTVFCTSFDLTDREPVSVFLRRLPEESIYDIICIGTLNSKRRSGDS
jgi:hypothetical protein